MTYYITATLNDKSRLVVSETRTTDVIVAHLVAEHLEKSGYLVNIRSEG